MSAPGSPTGFCRDCLAPAANEDRRCPSCGSPRLLRHPELHDLAIAHIDCDAFYAAVEKRDNPDLRDKPVIVGGGTRGVVSTCCYVARVKGVRSAMPMFKAKALCPEAVVIPPNMAKYSAVGREVRALMLELTPLVEPLSIDEAFLDLSGTARLHGMSPAMSLARLILRIEKEIGIGASVGLSYNKYLAKVASDLEKPRGFSVLGHAEAKPFLAARPVSLIWGVGRATQEALARDGITLIGQLQAMEKNDLMARYGSMGARLYHLARGEDHRHVSTEDSSKSISAETTFNVDIAQYDDLEAILWRLAERVSRRAKAEALAGLTVVLKLKTADFKTRTRNVTLAEPTLLATRIFEAARPLLRREATGTKFRLIGVGISTLGAADAAHEAESLDARAAATAKAELAIDRLREKFGRHAVERGITLREGET
ncbi:MAG: DNA polymerase IV [Alphaproteobacteria bacterium]|nr:DNA polymerase IV [Alphaproteobacteria bacterium]